jgi:hypothetical protein
MVPEIFAEVDGRIVDAFSEFINITTNGYV